MQQLIDLIKRIINYVCYIFRVDDQYLGSAEPDKLKSRGFRELPNGIKLPEAYNIDEVTQMIQAIHSVSDSNKRIIYDTVMVSALESITPLLDLYDLIPRIWRGDHIAELEFQNILSENYAGTDVKAFEKHTTKNIQHHLIKNKPDPNSGNSCNPIFFIKPSAINLLQQTAAVVTRNDEKYISALTVIHKMWDASICPGPDILNYSAHQNGLDGSTQVHKVIEKIIDKNKSFTSNNLRETRAEANGGYGGLTQPPHDEGSPWRPPHSGLPPRECGPDDGPVPDTPSFPEGCKLIRDFCKDIIRGAGRGASLLPSSIDIDNIQNISSGRACSGDLVTIVGSGFGHSQGDHTVVFGIQVAQVISWSDTKIIVRIPMNASGCIGIRDEKREEQRRKAYDRNQAAFDEIKEGATACFGLPLGVGTLPYRPDTPECKDINFINIGPPTIRFRANGGWDTTIEEGDNIVLSWSVNNADTMTIKRIGNDGPPANFTNLMIGREDLGAFTANSEITATYELSATNRCGSTSKSVTVNAIRTPELAILGIEVTQSIQRFNWNNVNQNNTVRLVSEKRTMVRVHVNSGVIDGFDFAAGPNILPQVKGSLRLTYPSGRSIVVNSILNPGQEINAQPLNRINRGILDHSLNFELPVMELDGTIQISATVHTKPRRGDGRYDSASTTVTFERNGELRLSVILVNDTINGNPAPSMGDFYATLQGARTRFPIKEQGFKIIRPENHRTINTQIRTIKFRDFNGVTQTIQISEDLSTRAGWSNLLARIDDIADDYNNPHEFIWVGLVPNTGASGTQGLATDTNYNFLWFDAHRRMLSKSRRNGVFSEEMAHTLSIDHAANVNVAITPGVSSCNSTPPSNIDSTLNSLTEDIGMDVAENRLMPAGIPIIMTYCTPSITDASGSTTSNPEDTWMSIDLWNHLWNRF